MCRLFFPFYLVFLATQFSLVVAQTCNSTTGTYQTCCPSSDKKALIFQGREYRVHCDAELGPLSTTGAASPDDCAKKCTNQSPLWRFDTLRGRGRCECYSFDTKTGRISFVPMDSEQAKDLDKCQAESKTNSDRVETCETKLGTCQATSKSSSDQARDCQTKLGTCQAGLTTCQGQQGQSDKDCPGKLQLCQDDLSRIDKTCPGKLQQCYGDLNKMDKTCPRRLDTCNAAHVQDKKELGQCKSDLKTTKKTLQTKTKDCPPKCRDKLNDCNKQKKKMCKCRPWTCTPGTRNIGGAKYQVHCYEWQGQYLPGKSQSSHIKSMADCATRCAKSSRCLWAFYYDSNGFGKTCTVNFDKWSRSRTETYGKPIRSLVLEKV